MSDKTSTIIKNRLNTAGVRYFVNDSIAEHISDQEKKDLILEVEESFKAVLDSLVIDLKHDPNSRDTPLRLAKMFVNEIMGGRYNPEPKITNFPNRDNPYNGMITIRAEINSLCAHHYQPISGIAYIGVLPEYQMLGLSKYIRLAQWVARRGTLQEDLTNQIADIIKKNSKSPHVGVYLEATHGCCENRGVEAHSSLTQTTVLYGDFNNADVKAEFMSNIALQKQHQFR